MVVSNARRFARVLLSGNVFKCWQNLNLHNSRKRNTLLLYQQQILKVKNIDYGLNRDFPYFKLFIVVIKQMQNKFYVPNDNKTIAAFFKHCNQNNKCNGHIKTI